MKKEIETETETEVETENEKLTVFDAVLALLYLVIIVIGVIMCTTHGLGGTLYHLVTLTVCIWGVLAAKILNDMGTDVGIESFGEGETVKYQYVCDDENYIITGNCTSYNICLRPNCKILSYVSKEFENSKIPFWVI